MSQDLNSTYLKFVHSVMSQQSKDTTEFLKSIDTLSNENVNVPMLITSAIGLSGEVGEFSDIVKKLIFQGKPMTDDIRAKMTSELSDICWYLAAGCMALGTDMDTLLKTNMDKLMSRYPNGKFSVEHSEKRKATDY